MPLGVSWTQYFFRVGVALGSMYAGSYVVYQLYQPLEGFDEELAQAKLKVIDDYRRKLNLKPKEEGKNI